MALAASHRADRAVAFATLGTHEMANAGWQCGRGPRVGRRRQRRAERALHELRIAAPRAAYRASQGAC